MSRDVRTFLLVLAGALVATVLLGSLARAEEYWAIPVILGLSVFVLLGIREYRKRKREEEQAEAKQARYARTMRRSLPSDRKKGGRNG